MTILDQLLSKQCCQELVEKLAGKTVYIPKSRSDMSESIKTERENGARAEDISSRYHMHVRNVYYKLKK
jgi:Mor family transcriptional regulator